MPVRSLLRAALAPVLLLLGLVVGGCGGAASDDAAGARAAAPEAAPQVHPWRVRAPYLPPPDPSLLRRARSADVPADAGTAEDGAASSAGAGGEDLDQAAIDAAGRAVIPPTAPSRLVALMQGANEVARKPYVYGGGHGRNPNEIWEDSAYDCSGSVSYALAAAGYLDGPVDSSTLMRFGRPGPGKWVTIYANAGHTFMVVAGLRYDTSGRQNTGTRWQSANARSYAGFVVRHPPGL